MFDLRTKKCILVHVDGNNKMENTAHLFSTRLPWNCLFKCRKAAVAAQPLS